MKRLLKVSIIFVATLVLCVSAYAQSASVDVKLCWLPIDNPDVLGYNIYMELPNNPTFIASQIDAGLPSVNADGYMVYQGVPVNQFGSSVRFRVAAYGKTGSDTWQGPRSNPLDISCATAEVVLGRTVCAPSDCGLRLDADCNGVFTINDVLLALSLLISPDPVPECTP